MLLPAISQNRLREVLQKLAPPLRLDKLHHPRVPRVSTSGPGAFSVGGKIMGLFGLLFGTNLNRLATARDLDGLALAIAAGNVSVKAVGARIDGVQKQY